MGKRQFGALRCLPSGRWQASFSIGGEKYRAPATFKTEAEARKWLKLQHLKVEAGEFKPAPKVAAHVTFGEYASKWVAERQVKPNTRAEYIRQLEAPLARFKSVPLGDINGPMIRTWFTGRGSMGAASRELSLLLAILRTAYNDGLIARIPNPSVKRPPAKRYRPPTEGELDRLLKFFADNAPELRVALLLAAYGGLRLSEWRALRRADIIIDGERLVVSVTRQACRDRSNYSQWIIETPKSASGIRRVTLPEWVSSDIKNHLKKYVPPGRESLLFQPRGRADFLDDLPFNRVWNRAREAAGLRADDGSWLVREHDLRAYAGTHFARAGATLKETMTFLGHSSTAAAMAYQHDLQDRAGELADRMPKLG